MFASFTDSHMHTLINCQDSNGINEKQFKIWSAAIEGIIWNKFICKNMEDVKIYKQGSVTSPFHQYQCYKIILHWVQILQKKWQPFEFVAIAYSKCYIQHHKLITKFQICFEIKCSPEAFLIIFSVIITVVLLKLPNEKYSSIILGRTWKVYFASKAFLNHY